MSNHINLFHKRKEKPPSPFFSEGAKRVGMGINVLLFIVFVVLIVMQFQSNNQLQKLQTELSTLNSYYQQQSDLVSKLKYLALKKNNVQTFLQQDADFVPYYQLLQSTLNLSTDSPNLQSMTIDSNQMTTFIVLFDEYDKMLNFFQFIETELFLDNFLSLRLNNFSLTSNISQNQKGYQLQFQGKFKPIDAINQS